MHGWCKLRNLFKGSKTRSEIVATFLAILELCKLRSISLEDDEDTTVRFCKMPDNEMEEFDGTSGAEASG